ncbi:MAG: hypothetical protein HY815_25090 [Candidatus Riflebacteria bacterium]|nr:hypothetical protein [Candidatus Riflebacteria bacterium]
MTRIAALIAGVTLALVFTGVSLAMQQRPASGPVLGQALPDPDANTVVRVADDLGVRLDLVVPRGAARVVVLPGPDASDGEAGWVVVYDAAGAEILRQRETVGVAVHLKAQGTLLRRLADEATRGIEVRLPAGTSRVRLVSQNYDHDSLPRQDGRLVAYGPRGEVLADEPGLELDILTP